jgi:peptide/nickel transport system substrate-binding protein
MRTRWLPGILLLALTIAVLGIAPEAHAFQVRDGQKILIFGARQAVPNLDPHVKTDWSTRTIQQSVYDALLKYEGNPPKLVPWLAESYSVSKDGMTYTFKIDKRAKFQNGEPVTAY